MTKTLIRGGTIVSMDPKVGDLPQGDVLIDGEVVLKDGLPTRVDLAEIRARAHEQSIRLFERLQ